MFCNKCGIELKDGSVFCSKCGVKISGDNQVTNNNDQPILVIKPKFVPMVIILSYVPMQLFFTVWCAGMIGAIANTITQKLTGDNNFFSVSLFFYIAIATFILFPIINYYIKKKTYLKTKYIFYSDFVEYQEGFWTIETKKVKYKNITESNFVKNIIQRMFDVGTIIFSTPATSDSSGKSRSGVFMIDVENPEELYKQVLEIIGHGDGKN